MKYEISGLVFSECPLSFPEQEISAHSAVYVAPRQALLRGPESEGAVGMAVGAGVNMYPV